MPVPGHDGAVIVRRAGGIAAGGQAGAHAVMAGSAAGRGWSGEGGAQPAEALRIVIGPHRLQALRIGPSDGVTIVGRGNAEYIPGHSRRLR